jgi:TPR repeat protein
MKSKMIVATSRAVLAAAALGVILPGWADEASADLQAGIEAFNRGDLPGAMALYTKAAEAGSPEAQVRLAYLLDYAEDNERALYWYREAAEQGYTEGIAGLASMYAKGEGVEEDPQRALELFEQAGEAGHAGSIRVLIGAYEKGDLGVEKDATKADYWRSKQAAPDSSGN